LGTRRTGSGVASKVLRKGDGKIRPANDDRVTLQYTSWKRDGTLADSSWLRGEPSVQTVRQLLPGLRETVQTMVVGEERRIWVPARLTFAGDDADQPSPNADLTFDLLLVDLQAAPPVPQDLRAPSRAAVRTASGLAYEILEKRPDARQAGPANSVTLYETGWTTDGVMFESTKMSGHPASYALSELLPGLQEGVLLMRVGEKARLWVPASLAYGDKPRRGAPAGMLVYDVDLVSVEGY
jgi:peptidylprolyl isomerase